jgi:hypothetical protein
MFVIFFDHGYSVEKGQMMALLTAQVVACLLSYDVWTNDFSCKKRVKKIHKVSPRSTQSPFQSHSRGDLNHNKWKKILDSQL